MSVDFDEVWREVSEYMRGIAIGGEHPCIWSPDTNLFSYSFITNVRQDFIEAMRQECKNEDTPAALYVSVSDSIDPFSFDELSEMWGDVVAFMKKRKHFRVIQFKNYCDDQSLEAVGLFHRLLAGAATSTIKSLVYYQNMVMFNEEAETIAAAIRSTNIGSIDQFDFNIGDFETYRMLDHILSTVLHPVLVHGVRGFSVQFGDYMDDLEELEEEFDFDDRDVPLFWILLATNRTTLKYFRLRQGQPPNDSGKGEFTTANHLSNVIKVNRGLEFINIENAIDPNKGRQVILNALQHNGTLLRLNTCGKDISKKEKQLNEEIDAALEINRSWNRYQENAKITSPSKKKTVLAEALLPAFSAKPTHVYGLLKNEIAQLLSSSIGTRRCTKEKQTNECVVSRPAVGIKGQHGRKRKR